MKQPALLEQRCVGQGLRSAGPKFHHELSQVGPRVLRVLGQGLLQVLVRPGELAVLQKNEGAADQGPGLHADEGLDGLQRVVAQELDAPVQLLFLPFDGGLQEDVHRPQHSGQARGLTVGPGRQGRGVLPQGVHVEPGQDGRQEVEHSPDGRAVEPHEKSRGRKACIDAEQDRGPLPSRQGHAASDQPPQGGEHDDHARDLKSDRARSRPSGDCGAREDGDARKDR